MQSFISSERTRGKPTFLVSEDAGDAFKFAAHPSSPACLVQNIALRSVLLREKVGEQFIKIMQHIGPNLHHAGGEGTPWMLTLSEDAAASS